VCARPDVDVQLEVSMLERRMHLVESEAAFVSVQLQQAAQEAEEVTPPS